MKAKKIPAIKKPTLREERFPYEYLIDLNMAKAAERCGYRGKTSEVLRNCAIRLLRKESVQKKLQELVQAQKDKLTIDAEMVIRELHHIATVDVQDAFNSDGTLKPVNEMPEYIRRSISAIEVEELFSGVGENKTWIGYTKRVKFWEKTKSLEMLGKHLKLWIDKLPKDEEKKGDTFNFINFNLVKPEEITDEHRRRLAEDIEILQRRGGLVTGLLTG